MIHRHIHSLRTQERIPLLMIMNTPRKEPIHFLPITQTCSIPRSPNQLYITPFHPAHPLLFPPAQQTGSIAIPLTQVILTEHLTVSFLRREGQKTRMGSPRFAYLPKVHLPAIHVVRFFSAYVKQKTQVEPTFMEPRLVNAACGKRHR